MKLDVRDAVCPKCGSPVYRWANSSLNPGLGYNVMQCTKHLAHTLHVPGFILDAIGVIPAEILCEGIGECENVT